MQVRLANLIDLSFTDTDGVACSLFFQGCTFKCNGCHNPQFQDMKGGYIVDTDEIIKLISSRIHWYTSIAFLGGEPLFQEEAVLALAATFRSMGLETWLYTGFEADSLSTEVLDAFDVIVAGRFVQELKTGGFPSSSNQQIIDKRRN